ncbi:hypothetical protein [Profundibacter sp.]
MPDIQVAVDEAQAGQLVTTAQALLGTQSQSGGGSLGPFSANWSASANFTGGSIDLRAPDIIRISGMDMNFTVGIGLSIDLNDFLPRLCIPAICIPIPFLPDLCTPRICLPPWPTISIGPISHSGTVDFTADFRLLASQDGTDWKIEIQIVNIPSLSLDAISALIVTGLIGAVALALLAVPFIGPLLSLATAAIGAVIGVAAVTGLLGPILGLFLNGLAFEVYRQPEVQQVLPNMGANDPEVEIKITALSAQVLISDEDELVIDAEIAAA